MAILKPGAVGKAQVIVSDAQTALAMGSGSLPVFATPALIALIEAAACNAIEGLDDGQTSVGIRVEVNHTAASPVGAAVTATARLDSVDGRTLHFVVSAADESGPIGDGTHSRVIVDADRFLRRTGDRIP